MTYQEYKQQEQEVFNNVPIFWAFSNDQFRLAMEERGLTENDTDKIYAIKGMNGAFFLREDEEAVHAYFYRPDKLRELMKDPEFAEEAFYYEMANHEYHINWQGDWDVCSCFGDVEYKEGAGGLYYLGEMGYGDDVKAAFRRAAARFFKDADEKGWY